MTSITSGTKFLGFKVATATGTNSVVTVTLAAVSGLRHYVGTICASYSADPTSGRLQSTGLDGDEIDLDITTNGVLPVGLPPVAGESGGAVTISLAAAGTGVTGKLTVFYLTFA